MVPPYGDSILYAKTLFYYPAAIYLFKKNNAWNLFKVTKETRITESTLFWCLYYYHWTTFTHFSGVLYRLHSTNKCQLVTYSTQNETSNCLTRIFNSGRRTLDSVSVHAKTIHCCRKIFLTSLAEASWVFEYAGKISCSKLSSLHSLGQQGHLWTLLY